MSSKISAMPLANALSGNELIEVVQDGANKKVAVSNLVAAGAQGLSAYQVAQANGYVGSESQWLASLHGATGATGARGADGTSGTNGLNGKSAYEVAVLAGFSGTQQQWLASLVGATGATGAQGPQGLQGVQGIQGQKGDTGNTGSQGPQGVQGLQGQSAYEIAVAAGFVGNQSAWLLSLKGATGNTGAQGIQGVQGIPGATGAAGTNGTNGKSAYELAVQGGYVGTESQWLASLGGGASTQVIQAIQTNISNLQTSVTGINNFLAGVNRPPAVVSDTASFNDDALVFQGNVLTNDQDPDNNPMTLLSAAYNGNPVTMGQTFNTAYGTMYFEGYGNWIYTPGNAARSLKVGQTGQESFSYTAIDNHGAYSSSTLLITVIGTDQAPKVAADDGFVPAGKTATGNVLANDYDPEGEDLIVTSFTLSGYGSYTPGTTVNMPGVGDLTLTAAGDYTFVPVMGYSGIMPTLSYVASDGTRTTTGILTVVVQPPPVARVSNPVTFALSGTHTYNVGPGQQHETPDTVPWSDLVAGDVVNIFYRPQPYVAKIAMRCRGTPALPVIINGVTDANGNRPIIDGKNARTPSTTTTSANNTPVFPDPPFAGTDGVGVIIIRRGANESDPDYKPGHIQVQNLAVTGAAGGNSYQTTNGAIANYSFSCGVYGRQAEHVLVENCLLYDNIMGIFTHVNGSGHMNRCNNWTIRSCRTYGNGEVGSNTEHGFYIQGMYFTTEYCFFGQNRAGANGSTFKSRVGVEVFRYNWVEAHARAMDFVEMEDQDPWDYNDKDSAISDPQYGYLWCYGNVIINDSELPGGASYRPIHFGGDNIGEQEGGGAAMLAQPTHRKKMWFYNNTFFSRVNGNGARNFIFQLSVKTITIEAWNNVFYLVGSVELAWTQHAGTIHFLGTNLIYRQGGNLVNGQYDSNPANISITYDTVISSDPLFLNTAVGNYDFTLAETSPALNVGTDVPVGMPAEITTDYFVAICPGMRTNGGTLRTTVGAGVDLGAFELDPNAPPAFSPVNTTLPSVTPTAAAVGDLLSTTTGAWLHNSAGTFAYQWQRNIGGTWTDINGATSSTFTTVDQGDHRCRVYATNIIGTSYADSDLSVVSTHVIVAPAVNKGMAAFPYTRNNAGFAWDTQTLTNIILFVVDSDTDAPINPSMIFDNAGNNGGWTMGGTMDLPDGTGPRRVRMFYKLNATGKTGHQITIYAGEQSYVSAFGVEILGNISVGTPTYTTSPTTPFYGNNTTIDDDSLVLAFVGTKFTSGGSFNWGAGFTKVANAELTDFVDVRTNGSVSSRIAAAGSIAPLVSIPTGLPDGQFGLMVVPVKFS